MCTSARRGQGSKILSLARRVTSAQPRVNFGEIGESMGRRSAIVFHWQNAVPPERTVNLTRPGEVGIATAIYAKFTPPFLTELRPVGGLQQPMLTIGATAEPGLPGRGRQ